MLVVASPAYKQRAERDAEPDEGRGVQFEARLIRDLFYANQNVGIRRFVPVVLPGGSAEDIPLWPAAYYQVSDFTVAEAEGLLRVLTRQPAVLVPQSWGRCRCCHRWQHGSLGLRVRPAAVGA